MIIRNKLLGIAFYCLVAASFVATTAFATDTTRAWLNTWNSIGGSNNFWVTTNWSPSGNDYDFYWITNNTVVAKTNCAYIASGTTANGRNLILSNSVGGLNKVYITSGGTMNMTSGNTTVIGSNGLFEAAGQYIVYDANSKITLNRGGTFFLNRGSLNWSGSAVSMVFSGTFMCASATNVPNSAGNGFQVASNGLLRASGGITYFNTGVATTYNGLNITNGGTLQIDSGATFILSRTAANWSTWTNAGTILMNGGTLQTADGTTANSTRTNYNSGAISGSGTILCNVISTGSINPGGVGAIGNPLYLGANLILSNNNPAINFDLSGTDTTEGGGINDEVKVTSAVTEKAAVTINATVSGSPTGTKTYTLMTWTSQSGSGFTVGTITPTPAGGSTLNVYAGSLQLTLTYSASTPPTLTASGSATVDAPFDVTFTDDAAWRAAITSITVGGTTLTAGYSASSGKITFTPSASAPASLLQTSGTGKAIVVIATGYSNATVSQDIGAGAATKLAVTQQPTAPASNGGALAQQPKVTVQDQYGNTVNSSATIVAAPVQGTWTLGGTTSVGASSGVATFSGLTATSAASVSGATLHFTSGSLTAADSTPGFTIPAPPPPTLTAAAGATVDGQFTVTFTDNSTWRAAITSITVGGSTLASAAYSISAGQIVFTPSQSTLLQSSGTKSIVVIATGYSNATVSQDIGAGAATKLAVTQQPTAPASNGGVLAQQPKVTVQDQYGNTVNSSATIVAAPVQGTWTLGGTTSVGASSGVATFSGLTATSAASVSGATIHFTSGSLTATDSTPGFTIPAPAFAYLSGSYTENFNSMGTGTAPPQGWSHIGVLGGINTTWAASIPASGSPSAASAGTENNTLTVNSDAANASAVSDTIAYNFALSGSTSDRALGTSPTDNAGQILQLRLLNNTGASLSSIRVGYDIRRFTVAGTANELPGYQLFYSTDLGTNWVNVSALNPVLTGGTVNVPNTTGTTTVSQATITLGSAVAAGAELRLRWVDDNASQSSPDQIIGLDNVTVTATPAITLGSNPTVCSGTTTANLTYAETTGSPDKYYIVYDGTAHSAGFTDVSNTALPSSPIVLTVPGGAAATTYNGTLTVSNSTTGLASSGYAISVTVASSTSISVQPTDQTACQTPGTASYSVTATGANLTYRWRLNGVDLSNGGQGNGSTVAGATSSTLSLSTLTSANTVAAGSGYDCVVSSDCSSPLTSSRVALTVNSAPSISSSPTNYTACAGNTAAFTVSASGGGLTYQWYKGSGSGVNLSDNAGNYSSTSWTNGSSGGNFGTTWTLNANSGGFGETWGSDINSPNGNAWLMWAGSGSTEALRPLGVSMQVGDTFSIDMDNATPGTSCGIGLRNASNANRFEFYYKSGQANYMLTTSAGVDQNSGIPTTTTGLHLAFTLVTADTFSLTYSNMSTHSTTTLTGTLAGTAGSAITSFRMWNCCNGGNNFACNNMSLVGATSTLISGATLATLTTNNVQIADTGSSFSVVVSNSCGTITSSTATLTVTTTPLAPTGTTPQTFCSGSSPTVANLVATGTAIQWYAAASGGSPLSTSTALANGTHYYASQTVGGCESSSRLDVTVTLDPASVGGTASGTTAICSGNSTAVSVSGYTGTIQWQQSTDGGSTWGSVVGGSGGTTASYTTANLTQTTKFRAHVTSGTCSAADSSVVTITVNTAPSAPTGSASQSFCSAASHIVGDLVATGTAIKWYDAASGGNLLTSGTTLVGNTHYYASQTVGCESSSRLDVTVTLDPASVGGTASSTTAICSGNSTAVSVSGYTGTIQWQQSTDGGSTWGSVVGGSGGTTASYTTANLTQTTKFRAHVTSGTCSAADSSVVTVTVNSPPSITVQPQATPVCSGSSANLTVSASATPALGTGNYAWRQRGSGWGSAWTFNDNGGTHGVWSSPNINTGGQAWAMNQPNAATTDALRLLGSALTVGQTFAIDMQHINIWNGGSVGFGLQNNGHANNRFEFYFHDGETNYRINDSISDRDTGVPFTYNGLHIVLMLTGIDTYSVSITPIGGSTTVITGTLTGTAGDAIDKVRLFNYYAGSGSDKDVFWNNISYGATDDNAGNYTSGWSGDLGQKPLSNGSGISGATTATLTVNPAAAGSYDVVISNSCGSVTSSAASLTVDSPPTTASISSSPLNVCGLTSGSLGGNSASVGSGAWGKVSGPGNVSFGDGSSGSSTATVDAYGTYVLRWTISNGTCTPSTADVTVNYNSLPAVTAGNGAPFYSGHYTIANGQALALNSSSATATSYSWSGPGGFSSAAQNPTIASVTGASSPYSDYTYTVTVTDGNGCQGTASTTVRVLTGDAAGVPDSWKTAHGYSSSKPSSDSGANGMTLLQNYLAGVDPTNTVGDRLKIANISVTPAGLVTVDWNSKQDGTTAQRLYDVYYTTGPFSNGVAWTRPLSNEAPQGAASGVEDDVSAATITQRFYRVTIAGHTNDVATPEIAGVHTLHLVEGANYVSLSMLPGTNTLLSVLGTNQLPQGSSESTATTVDIWDQNSQVPGATYWLATGDNGWIHHGNNAPSNGVLLDPNKGLAITIREGQGAQTLRIVGFVPTANEIQVVQGTNGYTVASSTFPTSIALNATGGGDGSGLVASGFLGGISLSRSDNLLFFNPVTQLFETRIWYNSNITDHRWYNSDGTVTTRKLQPGEAFLIQRSTFSGHAGNITWTNTVPYTTVPQLQGP